MGFSLSKVWKGVKKTFKKVGKGIKKAFQKYGKFMGKIGWLGQIAMTFIMPGIGSLLLKGLGSMLNLGTGITSLGGAGGLFANMAGSTNTFIRAAGKGLTAGYKAIADVTRPFTSVVDAVTTLGKTTVNKVGGVFGVTPFEGSAFSGYGKAFTSIGDDFSSMYDSKRWDALKNTTSNRETLNELQAMSDEKLAELGFDKGLEGATAVSEGYIDANIKDSKYQYTEFALVNEDADLFEAYTNYDPVPVPSSVGRGENVYEDTKSLLEDPIVPPKETFTDNVKKGAVNVALATAMAPDPIKPERAKQGFGWMDTDITTKHEETQENDPYDLWSIAYQEGDNNAISLIDGPKGGYGAWARRFDAFAPQIA